MTQAALIKSTSGRHSERSEESPFFNPFQTLGMLRFTQHDKFLAKIL